MFILPALMAIKIIDLKGYIKIINGNDFDIFFNIINNVDIIKSRNRFLYEKR